MGFGFKSINASGSVLIDQDYMNLSFQQKWDVTSMTASAFAVFAGFETSVDTNYIYFVADYPDHGSILAVRNSSGRTIAPLPLINETNSRNPPPSGYRRQIFYQQGTAGDTLKVYRFGNVTQTTPTGYGMIVKDPSGTVVFNNAQPPVRITQMVGLTPATVGTTFSLNSSQTYSFVFANCTCGQTPGNFPQKIGVSFQSASTMAIATIPDHLNSDGDRANGKPSIGAIVNVTGL